MFFSDTSGIAYCTSVSPIANPHPCTWARTPRTKKIAVGLEGPKVGHYGVDDPFRWALRLNEFTDHSEAQIDRS